MGSGHISNPSSYRGGSDNEKSSQRENNNYQRNPLSLAIKHHTTIGCPLTTGIFAWISAHAAEEQQQQGAREITPYWRTLKTGGLLNEKYPGGLAQYIQDCPNRSTKGMWSFRKAKNLC